jgi:hypothetical protein
VIVDLNELDAIRERSCTRKEKYTQRRARNLAASMRIDGSQVQAYRCPFEDEDIWHVGHVMAWEGVEKLAEALRFRAYPEGPHVEREVG